MSSSAFSSGPARAAPLDAESAEFLAHPEAAEWVRLAFESSPTALSLRDSEFRLVWANRAYEDLIGVSSTNLTGAPVNELLDSDDQEEAFAVGSELRSGQADEVKHRFRYRRPDGSTLIADVTLRALRSHDGVLHYMLGSIEDVTDRVSLARQLDLDQLVATTSARFVNVTPTSIIATTQQMLQQLANHFNCDRADLVDSDLDGRSARMGSTWAIASDMTETAELLEPVSAVAQAAVLRDVAGFDSIAVIPVVRGGRITERLLLSGRRSDPWSAQELRALEAIGNLLAVLHARIEAQIYLDLAFEDAPVGISVRNTNSELLAANQAYADFLGYDSPAEMLGASATGVVASSDTGVADIIPDTVGELGTFVVDRMEFRRKDGTVALGRVHAKRVTGLTESHHLILSHVEDLTATTVNERALELSQQRFRDLVENSPAITMLINRDLEITYASPSMAKIGWSPDELEGCAVASLAHESSADLATEVELVVENGTPRHFDWTPHGPDGDRWLRVAAVPETDADGNTAGVIMVAVDDSARRRTEGELIYQALHDPLTGLSNRQALQDHLERLLNGGNGTDVAVIFLDVDRFKVVNDSLGHGAGDELVKKVAQRLKESVRADNLVARFGGDEFVIVVEGPLTEEQVLAISRRIHENLARPIPIGEHELYVTVSAGIAFSANGGTEELIANADAAMYEAKEAGRNRTALHSASDAKMTGERFRTETELRHALPRGEFEPYFQAEVDLSSGELLGGETLIRWHHPEQGLLAAGQFVAIAEDCGLITDIGDWVMNEACDVLRDWQSSPDTNHLSVRVNLSANQLSERDVVGRVTQAISRSRVDPSGICLEITETVLMADAAASLKVLRQLRDLGLTLAVDDFGTGYSSLAYLKKFPVDILKIDRSFVDGLPHDPNDVAIVQSIIGLANALGLDIVAEGVENSRQGNALLSMGCRRAQGYHYGKPMPRAAFEAEQLFLDVLAARA